MRVKRLADLVFTSSVAGECYKHLVVIAIKTDGLAEINDCIFIDYQVQLKLLFFMASESRRGCRHLVSHYVHCYPFLLRMPKPANAASFCFHSAQQPLRAIRLRASRISRRRKTRETRWCSRLRRKPCSRRTKFKVNSAMAAKADYESCDL